MQIKLLTLDSSEYTLEQQLRKVSEEHHEVISCFQYFDIDLACELFDLMQACKTALEILDKLGTTRVSEAQLRHIAKLKQRAAEGKIKLVEDEE
jgi:hypothetical protein